MVEPTIDIQVILLVIALLSLAVKFVVDKLKPIISSVINKDVNYNSYALSVVLVAVAVSYGVMYITDLEPVSEFLATPKYTMIEQLALPILNAIVLAAGASMWREAPRFIEFLFTRPSLGDLIAEIIEVASDVEEVDPGA